MVKKKKDKKDKEKGGRHSHGTSSNSKKFVLPTAPAKDEATTAGAATADRLTVPEIKAKLRAGLFISESVSTEDLEVTEWREVICGAARQADLKQLALANGVSQNGPKNEILLRIIDSFVT